METISISTRLETIRSQLYTLEHLLTRSELPLHDDAKTDALRIVNFIIHEAIQLQSQGFAISTSASSAFDWPNGALHKVSNLLNLVCESLVEDLQPQEKYLKISEITNAIIMVQGVLEQDLHDGVN